MKVRDLMEVLNHCDPEGAVNLSLPTCMIDGDKYQPGVEYKLPLQVTSLWSTKASDAGGAPDIVIFDLPDREKVFLTRDWVLLASTVVDRALSESARDRIDALIAELPTPCAVRQMQHEPGRFVTHLVSMEHIRDGALVNQLRTGFEIIVRADAGELPLNPVLPPTFGNLKNEDRSAQELAVWWDQPYVQGQEAGPYTVHCLDGGAWDRPTSYGQAPSLGEATLLAAAKLASWRAKRERVMPYLDEPPCLVRMPQHPHHEMEVVRKFTNVDEMTEYVKASKSASNNYDNPH